MSKVFITGGCGYIGSRLVPAVIERGYEVRVLDTQYFGNHLAPSPHLEIIKGDLRDGDLVARCLEGVDAVIHLAAMSNDPSAELNPELTHSVNLEASIALIRRAKSQGVSRFVNASTATVYGVREEPDVTEDMEHRPLTLYGKYKSEVDLFLTSETTEGFAGVNLRAATVCGWSPRTRLDLTVNIFAAQCVMRGAITIHGGTQKRPNVVIDDVVAAYVVLLGADKALIAGESFNLCASNHSVSEIARLVAAAVRPATRISVEPTVDLRSYHISARKIADRLNFRCRLDLDDGARQVADAIESGRLADPDASIHVNIRHLREIGVATA